MQVEEDGEIKTKYNEIGQALLKLENEAESSSNAIAKMTDNYFGAATSFTAAARGGLDLFNQFDNLEKKELQVAKAENSIDVARASLLQSQDALAKLVAKGIESGTKYEAAQLRVKAAEEQLAISKANAKNAQEALSESQLQFALDVVPNVIGITKNMQNGIVAVNAAMTAQKSVNLGAIGQFSRLGGATGNASLGLRGLAGAARLAQVAMGPVGWVMLGVGTALTLISTNAFGVRDALSSLGQRLVELFPQLKPIVDFIGQIGQILFPEAKKEAEDFGATATTSLHDIKQEYPALAAEESRWVESSKQNQQEIAAQFQATSKEIEAMQVSASTDFSSMTNDIKQGATAQSAALGALDNSARNTSISVSKSLDDLARNAEKSADRMVKAAKKAAQALASLGLSSKSKGSGPDVKAAAAGLHGIVTEPTLILAGEAGPETVNITPINTFHSGSRPVIITVVTELDGREVARSVNRIQAQGMS